jgi:PTS system nitrogen regulatory IIA component
VPQGSAGELIEAIRPDLVFPELVARDRSTAIAELARGIAGALPKVEAGALARGFAEREALGSTALGRGLAVPHCKVAGLSRAYVAVGVSPQGVDFGAPDGAPVRVFFAVISPAETPAAHLRLLAAISRWAKIPGRLDRLSMAATTEDRLAALDVAQG